MFVLLYHYGSAFPRSASPVATRALAATPLSDNWLAMTWPGWIGVEIFFVISGFVIAISAEGSSRPDFIRRRFLRLAPTAWICATITFAIILLTGVTPLSALASAWVRSMLFWPFGVQIDPVYWTLGIELAFYAAIATTLGQQGSAAKIEAVAASIGVVSTLFWLLVVAGAVDPIVPRWAQLLMLQHGCFFALGVTIWAFLDRGISPARLAAFLVFFGTALLAIGGHAIDRCRALGLPIDMITPQFIFALAIGALTGSRYLQPALARLHVGKIAPVLGLMTYPLYLVHQDAGAIVIAALRSTGLSSDLSRALTIAIMLMLAYVIVIALKSPTQRLADLFVKAKRGDGIRAELRAARPRLPALPLERP